VRDLIARLKLVINKNTSTKTKKLSDVAQWSLVMAALKHGAPFVETDVLIPRVFSV